MNLKNRSFYRITAFHETLKLRALNRLLICLISIPIATGCSSEKSVEWTEDVKLHDGRIVQAQRRFVVSTFKSIGEGGGQINTQEICIPSLKLYIKMPQSTHLRGIEESNGRLYARFRLTNRTHCREFDMPNPAFGDVIIEGKSWRKISGKAGPSAPMSVETYPGVRGLNILISTPDGHRPETWRSGHISLDQKADIDAHLGTALVYDGQMNRDGCVRASASAQPFSLVLEAPSNFCVQ